MANVNSSNTPRGASSFTGSGLMGQSSGGFADPLATSTGGFGDVDPWSGTQSPARAATPQSSIETGLNAGNGRSSGDGHDSFGGTPALDALIDDPPEAYIALFRQLEPGMSGKVSIPAIQRLLSTSRLPASTVEKIVNLTGRDKATLGRADFYRTLALVALAQSNPDADVSLSAVEEALPGLPSPKVSIESPAPKVPARPSLPQSPSTTFSPWDTTPQYQTPAAQTYSELNGAQNGGNPDAEAERGYWRRLENITIELIPQKEGWFLQKYRLSSDKRPDTLSRRYSDFVWLHSTLLQRYPFRLLPALPPKRMNPDAAFLETRRKGLQRFINAVCNHPVIRDDGALNVFLTEPNFEAWRKRVKVSTDEESTSKRLNPAQEMAIPADLEEKLEGLRSRLPSLISSYQKMVTLAERELQRRQMSAAEATRFALSLQSVAEDMPQACYRCVPGGKCCDVCQGTGRGLATVGYSWSRLADQRERELTNLGEGIEALKRQRDLYISFRDLFNRHEHLSRDSVDALQKRVVSRQGKIEALRQAQKPGWDAEVGKLVSAIDQDNSTIAQLLSRRVFIRACMWHELGVVFHSRQSAQATLAWQAWVAGETTATRAEANVWERLNDDLESMPLE